MMSRSPRTRTIVLATTVVGLATLGLTAPSYAAPAPAAKQRSLQQADTRPTQDGPTLSKQVTDAKKAAGPDGNTAIIVKLKDDSLAAKSGSAAAKLDVGSAESRAYRAQLGSSMTSFENRVKKASPKAKITSRLDVVVGGVAMVLPADDVEKVAKDPSVQAIYPDVLEQPQTSVSPRFIGAPYAWAAAGGQSKAGEGAIVGVIDSGIWPEHPSMSDPDPSGKAYPEPPGTYKCEFGSAIAGDAAFTCNNKLIGGYRFMDTYELAVGLAPGEFESARDDDGHGTHTATTAAGNGNVAASIFGVPRGTVSGIAPRAHVIAYKVCGLEGCYSSDSAAAVQQAILDGVDAINFSISGGANPYSDAVSLAFLDAYNAGVFVAASAGNSGPGADTTDHREPWVTTVAASTGPRSFVGSATLTSGSDTLTVSGTTVTASLPAAPVVVAGGDGLCSTPAAPGTYTGKVVVCQRGGTAGRVQKGYNVLQGGAVGMIIYNQSAAVTDLETDNHFLPAVQIQNSDGLAVVAFVTAHADATASIAGGVAKPAQGDVMASFSSRGGPGQPLGISKPDVTAPGVQILAGASPQHVDVAAGPNGELFQAIAGTSMSSPHVAGAGALLASLHPDWTPGQIHSALMTTAATKVVKEDGVTPTDAFDDGSGRINLATAKDPYFTIDETGDNFVANKADLSASNYPSVYVPALAGQRTVTRTLKSVSTASRFYRVSVDAPADFKVTVSPKSFTIPAGGSKAISISIDGKDVPLGETRFATVTLTSGKRSFTVPVSAIRRQGPVAVTKTCDPASVAVGATATCTVTMTNNSPQDSTVTLFDRVPANLKVVRGSVTGGTSRYNDVTARATIPAKEAPGVSAAYAQGSSPAGYVSLAGFAGSVVVSGGDETITNFNVPAFTVAGVTYSRIGIVSNGYAVVGGGTGADVNFVNQDLPDPAAPNNVLAPFWTDLNPGAGGRMLINVLSDGADSWIVVEWEAVKEYSTAATNSFQIWIGIDGDANPGEDVTMTYGTLNGNGDGGFLTIGAENPDGTQGTSLYLDGVGTFPSATNSEVKVTGTPGSVSSATVTYQVKGVTAGDYVNYAFVSGNTFPGKAVARFAGSVGTVDPN